jgi:L-fuconolactonase
MVTEADSNNWTEAQFQPYLNTVLEAFGPNRVLFGSDWPVCLVACKYTRWVSIIETFISKLTADEQTKIMGENACTAYKTG